MSREAKRERGERLNAWSRSRRTQAGRPFVSDTPRSLCKENRAMSAMFESSGLSLSPGRDDDDLDDEPLDEDDDDEEDEDLR